MSTLNVGNINASFTIDSNILETTRINHTNGTNALLIDSGGRVSRPNIPAFYGYRDIGTENWESFTTQTVYNYNTAIVNRGNCYNPISGIFTAPVSGIYAVNCGMLVGQGGGGATLQVYVNGINKSGRGVHENSVNNNIFVYCSHTFLVSCEINDQISIRISTFSNTPTNNSSAVYGREHNHLSIWLYG